jgi:hypothetical protein
MTLWDRLLPQTILTLNLLWLAKADQSVSAYQFMHGEFDYNKMLLAPLGCAVQIHESTNRQRKWNVHSLNGWYLGTSNKHYRCYTIYCTKTRAKRIFNTVFFQHRYLTQPVVTPADAMIKAMGDLRGIFKKNSNNIGAEEMEVLKQLDTTLSGPVAIGTEKPRQVTFAMSTTLEKPLAPLREQITASLRVPNTLPRVVTSAVVDKPYGALQGITTRSRAKAQQLAMAAQQRHHVDGNNYKLDFEEAMNVMECNLHSKTAQAIFDNESGQMLKYWKLITHPKYREVWSHSSSNEFGRLAQGVGSRIKGTNTIFFVQKKNIPADQRRDVTYGKFVCEYKPNKTEQEQNGMDKIHRGRGQNKLPWQVCYPDRQLNAVQNHVKQRYLYSGG